VKALHWSPGIALRDFVELLLVFAFGIVVPPLLEAALTQRGVEIAGTNRILLIATLQIALALFAFLLMALKRESLSTVGLAKPASLGRTVAFGLILAAAIFATVATLEHLGYGKDRLGDIGQELKGNAALVIQRVAISLLVVGFVEEFIFRGFVMSRIAGIFGGSNWAWALALIGQAALFGAAHGYQQLYGMSLTGGIGLLLGSVYLLSGRNLWIPIIGHGVYDAVHATYISGVLG
jgi:membrane protease YdiL (CAAX protease family)